MAPFSPLYWLLDPDGQRRRLDELAQSVRFSIGHPTEFLKAAANWEDLEAGRFGEWLGNFGPDALLAAATAGAGGVAAGASRGARAADAVGDLAEAARQADRAAPPTARTVPMGVTASRFEEMSQVLRRGTGHLDGIPMDISVVKRGGAFDQGPYIPIP